MRKRKEEPERVEPEPWDLPDGYVWTDGLDPFPPPNCERCGVLVNLSMTKVHDDWHERMA
jgi:hypothetical protein